MAKLRLDPQTERAFEQTLKRLELAVRSKNAKAVMRKSGNEFAKEYRRQVHRGNPEHTPEIRQLYQLVSTKVVDYNNGVFVAISGVRKDSQKGEGVYHHLVESGFIHHGTKARIPGKQALVRTDVKTRKSRMRIIREELAKVIIEAAK